MGTPDSKGTKVFALTGKIKKGGLVEIPMGKTCGTSFSASAAAFAVIGNSRLCRWAAPPAAVSPRSIWICPGL